jgi:hypothetical protein
LRYRIKSRSIRLSSRESKPERSALATIIRGSGGVFGDHRYHSVSQLRQESKPLVMVTTLSFFYTVQAQAAEVSSAWDGSTKYKYTSRNTTSSHCTWPFCIRSHIRERRRAGVRWRTGRRGGFRSAKTRRVMAAAGTVSTCLPPTPPGMSSVATAYGAIPMTGLICGTRRPL